MPAMQQNPDGTWTEATPLAYQPGYDAEIGGKGPYNWELYHAIPEEARQNIWRTVARGRSRTHLGASLRLLLAKWWDSEKLTIPYRIWYRLYRTIRIVKHRLGLHDWREQGVVDHDDPVYVRRHLHCDWCGASKPAKARRS